GEEAVRLVRAREGTQAMARGPPLYVGVELEARDAVLTQGDEQERHDQGLVPVVADPAEIDHRRPAEQVREGGGAGNVQHGPAPAPGQGIDPGRYRRRQIRAYPLLVTARVHDLFRLIVDALEAGGPGRRGRGDGEQDGGS